jgi:uncharacterized protein DUF2442
VSTLLTEPRVLSPRLTVQRTDLRITIERLPEAVSVFFEDDLLVVELGDGRSIQVPLEWFPWLVEASRADRESWELVGGGIGIYWPRMSEDLFVLDLLLPQGPPRRTGDIPPLAQRLNGRSRGSRR